MLGFAHFHRAFYGPNLHEVFKRSPLLIPGFELILVGPLVKERTPYWCDEAKLLIIRRLHLAKERVSFPHVIYRQGHLRLWFSSQDVSSSSLRTCFFKKGKLQRFVPGRCLSSAKKIKGEVHPFRFANCSGLLWTREKKVRGLLQTIKMGGYRLASGVSFGATVGGWTCFGALEWSTFLEETLQDVCKDIGDVLAQTGQLLTLQDDFSSWNKPLLEMGTEAFHNLVSLDSISLLSSGLLWAIQLGQRFCDCSCCEG